MTAQEDRKRLAEKLFAEGRQFQLQGTGDSLRKALESYEKALALWRSLDDRRGQAGTLREIGVIHYLLDEKHKALDIFQQELQLWQVVGAPPRETAEALNNIGVVYSSLGLPQKSIESYREALALRQVAGDRAGIANTLDNIGLSYLGAGQLQKALDYFNQALALFRELNQRTGIANILNNIGGVHFTWGDYRKALEHFGEALELRRALGHRREEAIALNNIGRMHDLLGEAQKALDYHRQALGIRRELGHMAGVAASINNIGFVYGWLGEKQKALEHYKQALDLFRAASDRNGEAAALNNIGAFYLGTLREPQTALEYYRRALEMRRALGQPIEEASMLGNIGIVYNTLRDPRKALEYHRQSLEMRRTSGHRLGEGASLTSMGATHFEMGELQAARDYFSQALGLHRAVGSREMEAVTLYGMARVERDRGDLAEARLRMEESLDIIESLRGKVASQDLRASFLAQKQDYYEFYIDLLMRSHQREPSKGHDVAALETSERARARSLHELLAESRIDVEQGIEPELKQRQRITHGQIAWIQSHLIEARSQVKPDQSKIATLEEELKKADAEREQLNMEIRQKHPRYADLQYQATLGLSAIQSLLDDRTVVLEYALGQDGSFLFAVTKNDFLVARLPPAASLITQVEALRLTITDRPQRNTLGRQINHSRQLYRELIEPAGKLLSGKQKLIIVPSGILHYLPFEVLLSAGEERTLATAGSHAWPYLLRDYAISYVPSVGVLASLRSRRQEKPDTRKTFIAFADPVYGNETGTEASLVRPRLRGAFGDERWWKLERLAESRREVEQIASLYARDQVSLLLGEQAREENAKTAGRLSQYRFVHFATHGLLNEDRPPYSGLILSLSSRGEALATATRKPRQAASQGTAAAPRSAIPNPSSPDSGPQRGDVAALLANGDAGLGASPQLEDGLLQVYEIFNLKLNADLVVLSACETGLGKEVKGEGLIGLTRAFLYAGTPSVLVSLWNVQDRSTADLMVNFYQQLDRVQNKAEALRQAKLTLIQGRRYAHPYYWAPFILIGEPK